MRLTRLKERVETELKRKKRQQAVAQEVLQGKLDNLQNYDMDGVSMDDEGHVKIASTQRPSKNSSVKLSAR